MRCPRIISSLLLGVAPAVSALAQGDEPPPLRMDAAYASRHVFRGVVRTADSVQANVKLNRGNFRGGLWTNQPFARESAREVNLNAGYGWQATEGLTVDASITHTWFGNVPGGGVVRSWETGLTATLAPMGGFTPSLAYYHDFNYRADTVQVSFARSVALTKLGAFLELNFSAGWARGADWRPEAVGSKRRDGYGYWGGEARLPYRIGVNSTVVAGLHYAATFERSPTTGPFGRTSRGNLWVTLGVNLDF